MTDSWEHRYRPEAHSHGHGHGHANSHALAGAELAGIVAMFGAERGAVIDVGCGSGADAVYLAQRGFTVTGIDSSPAALERAAERAAAAGVEVAWVPGDALALPVDDASIVAAFDRGCLHHVAADDQPTYVAELARVLKPGGRVILRDTLHPGHHVSPVTPDGLARLVDDLPLAVSAVVPFDTQAGDRRTSWMLAVLERD